MKFKITLLGRHEAYLRLYSILTSSEVIKNVSDENLKLERKLASELIKNWRESYNHALREIFTKIPKEISNKAVEVITQGLADTLGPSFGSSQKVRDELKKYITKAYHNGKSEFAVGSVLSLPDLRAIDILTHHNCFWLGEHYGKRIGKKIAKLTQQAIDDGLGRNELAENLREALGGKVGGYKYWDVVSSAALVRSRSFGCIAGMEEAGITEYEILAMDDERMCDICGNMNGRVFSVAETRKVIDKVLDIEKPEKFKEAMPWHTTSPKDVDNQTLQDSGMSLPPFHGRCRCTVVMISESEAETAPDIKGGLELAEGLIPETAESLRDTFLDSPQFIKDLYSEHKENLFGILLDLEPNYAYYDSQNKILHFHNMKNALIVSHEFGHHVDFSMGNASSHNNIFMNAVKQAMDNLKGKGKHKTELREKLENTMSDPKTYYDESLSDIFCALVRANKRYKKLWGCAGHDVAYYEDNQTVRAEIFANLFSIYSQNDSLAISHLQNTFPDIITAFLEITNGAGENDK